MKTVPSCCRVRFNLRLTRIIIVMIFSLGQVTLHFLLYDLEVNLNLTLVRSLDILELSAVIVESWLSEL